jgi:hypothetical protein
MTLKLTVRSAALSLLAFAAACDDAETVRTEFLVSYDYALDLPPRYCQTNLQLVHPYSGKAATARDRPLISRS